MPAANGVSRATALVENVLDFARGRLGEGLTLTRHAAQPLTPVLEQVVGEIRAIAPDRQIIAHFSIEHPVDCDPGRIGQLASNLIANALTHGAPGVPIEVEAHTRGGRFVLSVPMEAFRSPRPPARSYSSPSSGAPFAAASKVSASGSSSSTRLQRRTVASSEEETRFTFSMPLKPA